GSKRVLPYAGSKLPSNPDASQRNVFFLRNSRIDMSGERTMHRGIQVHKQRVYLPRVKDSDGGLLY
ncbi:hypothetical protein PMAYCL1PPCAC_10641, partial [Pristionchus mayeri]